MENFEKINKFFQEVSENNNIEEQLEDLKLNGYEEILITDTPETELWELTTLYNISQIGKDMMWKIYVEPDNKRLVIIFGYVDGKKQTEYVNIILNNSGRNFQEQALQEAKKRYNDKISSGYKPKYIDNNNFIIKFQLANKFVPPNIGKTNITNFPVCVQCKIDGIRAAVYLKNDVIQKTSRTNKSHKPMWFDEQLKILLSFLPPNTILDGELYSTELNFNQISSIVRTFKTTTPEEIKIKYYIFDLIMYETILEDRIRILNKAYENYKNAGNIDSGFIIIPSIQANNYQDLESFHDFYVNEKYEGIMIRNYSITKKDKKFSYYKGGRNNNLLKYKKFIDEEAIIIDVTSCIENNLNLAMFKVKDIRGNIFEVRPSGSFDDRIYYLMNKEKVINKKYTIKYFQLTPDGIPRFPIGKGFRDELD